ncbi:DUF3302 domain-containing protein [Pseudoxanthomonas koreensis]|uniref:DUF3302 domain-containing protein n=1 Tax=Pseudoxanthomonas koreensis TaxID=266061 RepID=UPI0013913F3E|nr:DUF3302 domain-containing protein [Pseudoxanthomonas koreensis]KAF1694605.1 hypothetical protein CSC64_04115 [Pseudoxanthomonas koreensis]
MSLPRRALRSVLPAAAALAATTPGLASASLLSGEALDTAADVIAWLALIVVPVVLIAVFWLVHILPEKIAHNRRHPQLGAIKILCLLSLVFGGLLWPLAWLWAYTKPVLHKLAYGTDQDDHQDDHDAAMTPLKDASSHPAPATASQAPAASAAADATAPAAAAAAAASGELEELRRRLRALEMAMAMSPGPGRAKDPAPPAAGPT